MTTYTKATNFAAKDALLTGNPSKIVKGTEIDVEFTAIQAADATSLKNGGALGTPSSGTLTNCTGLPVSTGVSGLGTNVATFLATPSSANLAAALTDETGSGANVFATSPTLVTPLLGTPTSGTLTNCTGLPVATGISGLGTGVATALAVNVGSAGAPVINGGALGTPSSGTVTNLTGTASININGTVGATTPTTGVFTTLSAAPGVNGTTVASFTGSYAASGTVKLSEWKRVGGVVAADITYDDANNRITIGTSTNHDFSVTRGGSVIGNFASTGLAVTGTLSATGNVNLSSGSSTANILHAGTAGKILINGDSGAAGAQIQLFGSTHATLPKQAFVDADTITFRNAAGTSTLFAIAKDQSLALQGATSAAGCGIAFPAAQVASSDANTLDDYEEGVWTPVQGAGLTVVGAYTSSGTYTKVGRSITVHGRVNGATSVAVSAAGVICTGLPVASANFGSGSGCNAANTTGITIISSISSLVANSAISATTSIFFSCTYEV